MPRRIHCLYDYSWIKLDLQEFNWEQKRSFYNSQTFFVFEIKEFVPRAGISSDARDRGCHGNIYYARLYRNSTFCFLPCVRQVPNDVDADSA
jgi:hypothetical protein